MDIIIKHLTPDLLDDYLYLFDNMIFTENPDWEKCYCYSFHFTGPDEQWNKKDNRIAVSKMINEEKMKGYLAFSDGIPVGWCNVNDRNNYQRLMSVYDLDENLEEKICSIVCFLICPEFRGKGIAGILLDRLIKDYSSEDYTYLEAYPAKGDISCEKNYKGPLSLYEQHDFKIKKEHDNYYVVRKVLK